MPIGIGAAILGGAGISAAGSLLGGLFGGKKPKVPELKPIDFAAEQKQAIQQNIASLESASDLARKTTAAEQSQLEAQLRRAIPGYDQLAFFAVLPKLEKQEGKYYRKQDRQSDLNHFVQF